MKRKLNKSQSLIEYCVLIGIFTAAMVAMRVFMVRAFQEKYRQSADVFGQGEQYEPHITVIDGD